MNNNGSGLLLHYGRAHSSIIMSVFKDYNWLPWKFLNSPKGYWKDIQNQRKCLDCLAQELNIKEMDDWYKYGIDVN